MWDIKARQAINKVNNNGTTIARERVVFDNFESLAWGWLESKTGYEIRHVCDCKEDRGRKACVESIVIQCTQKLYSIVVQIMHYPTKQPIANVIF